MSNSVLNNSTVSTLKIIIYSDWELKTKIPLDIITHCIFFSPENMHYFHFERRAKKM